MKQIKRMSTYRLKKDVIQKIKEMSNILEMSQAEFIEFLVKNYRQEENTSDKNT